MENTGKIIRVMGPVVDVRFDSGKLPKINEALDRPGGRIRPNHGGCPAAGRRGSPLYYDGRQ